MQAGLEALHAGYAVVAYAIMDRVLRSTIFSIGRRSNSTILASFLFSILVIYMGTQAEALDLIHIAVLILDLCFYQF